VTDEDNEVERERDQREIQRWLAFARRTASFWPTLLLSLGLAAVAAALLLYLMRPSYRSETVILYSQGMGSTDPAEQGTPRNATARLKELLLSRRELSRIVNEFGLYPSVRESYGADDAVDELKRHLEFRAPGGDTFSIAFQGGSPSEAQRVTAALAKMVIDGDAKLRKSQTEFAQNFLTNEKKSKADTLKEAEQRLAAFMAQHRRFALDTTPLAAGAAIRATQPGAAPSAAVQQWVRAPLARPRSAGSGQPATAAPAPAAPEDSGERSRAVAALAAARANLAEQLGRNTEAHPDVRAAQASVERATARLEALGQEPRLVPATPAAPAPPAQSEAQARSSAPVVRPVAGSAPAQQSTPTAAEGREDVVKLETEWLRLTRAVTEARQRLDQIESALFKADIQASSERSGSGVQISVIDPAYLPQRPIGLSRTAIVGGCLFAGILFGLIAAALRAAFDDRILEARDLGRKVPMLVQVPRLAWRGRSYGSG
jgi:uncharacterized protein involved in exopolysaccharide biosynthesis